MYNTIHDIRENNLNNILFVFSDHVVPTRNYGLGGYRYCCVGETIKYHTYSCQLASKACIAQAIFQFWGLISITSIGRNIKTTMYNIPCLLLLNGTTLHDTAVLGSWLVLARYCLVSVTGIGGSKV